MGDASYTQNTFHGGEISPFAQGRIDLPTYRQSLNACLNGLPIEEGAWVRRPGSAHAGLARGGASARTVKFDFRASSPYTLEFSNGYLRFRIGTTLASTNDSVSVSAVSAATPAEITTSATTAWSTGNTVMFEGSNGALPLLENRQFTITVIDDEHFTIADAITGAPIAGAGLGTVPATLTVERIQEVTTPYVSGSWASLVAVQAEANAVLLQATIPPQILTATTLPATGIDAQFTLSTLIFQDGPYLDPPTNGVQVTPSAVAGSVTLTLAFPAYVSTQAYAKGAFVTASSVNYVSLIDDNVGNTPASSASDWAVTSAAAAINGGLGFLGSDVGRMVRLLSEPALWAAGTTYSAGTVISYNPTGQPGAATYWASLTNSNTGNVPGANTTSWQLSPLNASIWSWGKITSLTNQISQSLSGSVAIGTMTGGGGIAAAFNGNSAQAEANSAAAQITGAPGAGVGLDVYVGKNYSGASAQKIQQVVLYPPTDQGFASAAASGGGGILATLTVNLRASNSPPATPSSGTLLGTVTFQSNQNQNSSALAIVSSDQTDAWDYVWIEMSASTGGFSSEQIGLTVATAQVYFFNPPGTGVTSGVAIELLGPPLLYTNPIVTWRLGVYSNTTGFPTCGCYHEGRLWLGGAVDNRWDASVSNGIVGDTVNFAPTDQNGNVGGSNAIDYTMNSDGVNPIQWMMPDQQGVIMETLAGEWLTSPPGAGEMTVTNVTSRRVTKIGGSPVPPVRTDHTLLFVQRYARKLMEYFADVFSGKFSAPNLADRAMHLTLPGIAEVAYQSATTPVVWGRCNDGSLFGITYKRDSLTSSQGPTYAGWHRHVLGSGRTVASLCAGPSVGGDLDALTMVTLDSTTGLYHVEVITDITDESATLLDAAYLDNAINPSSVSSSNTPIPTTAPYGGLTLNGLWHLNGKTATAWLGGLDCGDWLVSNGSIFVPYGDGVSGGTGSGLFTAALAAGLALSQMLVGFTFTSQGQLVRPALPAESGARTGPALGKKRRTMQYAALLQGAGYDGGNGGSITFGTDPAFVKMDPALFRQPNGTSYPVTAQFSGVYWATLTDTMGDGYDSMLCWQITRPYPANVVQLGAFLRTEDK